MSSTQTAESSRRQVTKASPKSAPAKKGKAAPPKPVETITLKSMFETIAETQDLTKKQANAIAAVLVAAVTSALKAGDRVRLTGLGVLEVKDQPARTGRNPKTGVPLQIEAGRKVFFRASKELKEAV